jgi:hypothetical protein
MLCIVRKKNIGANLQDLPTAYFPPEVFAPLVEIVATMLLSALTASKSNTRPI